MGPRRWTAIALVALLAGMAPILAACGGDDRGRRPRVVVTTPVLGSVVRELVGDAADVTVVMPNGADPHEFQPSAKDVERGRTPTWSSRTGSAWRRASRTRWTGPARTGRASSPRPTW